MEQVKGYVEHIIYRNDDNGYTVMNLMNGEEEIVCVGNFRTIDLGETLEVSGNYTEHPMYGIQLKAESYRVVEPDDEAGMERYLASGAIKGIGAALASRIIKKFGKDTFRIIEEEPERLAEIKGISEKKAREIAVRMEEKKDMRSAMVFLQKYGISDAMAVRIYNTYGEGIYGVMRENPYRLAEDVGGIGFRAADEIARKAGIHMDSDYRIRSGILYALAQSMAEGNIYLPENILLERCTSLLEVDKEGIEPQISNLAMEKKIVVKLADEKRIYAASAYYEELNCAKMLHDLNISMTQGNGWEASEEKRVQQRISMLEKTQKIRLDELQKQAVLESIRSGIMILTGGPGTGKTTTINTMIGYFAEEGMDIFLAAPTGRAAKRMTEATGYEAKTIHRLLELNGASVEEKRLAKFERNEENPLEADVIIIDEMSMVDIHLFQALLKAVIPGTRLIMAGDINQLPSVGPGQVLRDLIDSECFPKVMLQKIFRQAEKSDIVVNAHRINEGKEPAMDNKSMDFFFLERNDANVIYKHMIQLIREKLPSYVNAGSFDIQVLTPMRKGNLGVEVLNGILQEYLNPPDAAKEEYPYGNGLFRVGDKVMQTKNNYQMEWEVVSKYGIPVDKGLGIFNGDMGVIKEINDFSQEMVVEFDERRRVSYPFHQLDEIELAYAITIHKSQGSEYAAVIMPLLSGPKMLCNRNLLYTGVTRAKYCVTILGSRQMVKEMVANQYQNKRYTSLCHRIKEMAVISGKQQ